MWYMNSFVVPVTCWRCGGPVDLVNAGKPVEAGAAINAVIRCVAKFCRAEAGFHVRLMPMGTYNDEGEAHGNGRAYHNHKRVPEPPCDECKAWHARSVDDKVRLRRELGIPV
jgi:hypothetical protein